MSLINLRTVSNPNASELAITLAEAKAHCYIVPEDYSQDEYLTNCIQTAQSVLENDKTLAVAIFSASYEATFYTDRARVLLPKSPAKSIQSIESWNGETWEAIANFTAEFGNDYDFVVLKDARRGFLRRLKIEFTAGATTASEVRLDVKRAVACLTAQLFEFRSAINTQQVYDNQIYKRITDGLRRISI